MLSSRRAGILVCGIIDRRNPHDVDRKATVIAEDELADRMDPIRVDGLAAFDGVDKAIEDPGPHQDVRREAQPSP